MYDNKGVTGLKNLNKIKIEQFAPVEVETDDAKKGKKKRGGFKEASDGEEENDEVRR